MAVPVRDVQQTHNDYIDGLLSGSRWDPATEPVTFSFPESIDGQVSAAQMDAIRFFAASVNSFTELDITEISIPLKSTPRTS